MNSILSIFVCLAMLLSGAYTAEDPAALASASITLSDVTFYIDEASYKLDPTLTMSALTENGEALFDLHMNCGEEVLFPIQLKLMEEGIGLLLDGSTYLLPVELVEEAMDGEEIPAEILPMIDEYCAALAQIGTKAYSEELTAQLQAYVTELIGDNYAEEPATIAIDDVEHPATRTTFTLSHDQLMQLIDYEMELVYGDAMQNMYDMINNMAMLPTDDAASIAIIGGADGPTSVFTTDGTSAVDTAVESEPVHIDSYSDLMAASGVEMSFDIDVILTDEHAGVGTMTINVTAEGETISLPMDMIFYDEDTFEMSFEMAEEGVEVSMSSFVDGMTADVAMVVQESVEEGVEPEIAITMSVHQEYADSGLLAADVAFNAFFLGEGFSFSMTQQPGEPDGMITDIALDLVVEGVPYGLSLRANTASVPIADSFADAAPMPVESEESLNALSNSAMSLLNDAAVLMTNESVQNAVAALTPIIAELSAADEIPLTDANAGYDDPADLSFPIPEFGWLPEGYELSTSYIYADSDCANLYFDYAQMDDEYHSTLYIDLYALSDPSMASYPELTIMQEDDGSLFAAGPVNGAEMYVYYYGSDLTPADMETLFGSLIYAE